MLMARPNFILIGNRTDQIMMKVRDLQNLVCMPAANELPIQRKVLRRGENLMVVLKGCPPPAEVGGLQQAGVHVGLALSSGDLARVPKLNRFSYVFVAIGHDSICPLKRAITDLARNGWTLDDDEIPEIGPIEPHFPRAPIRSAAKAIAQC